MSDFVYSGVSPLSFSDKLDNTSHSQNDGNSANQGLASSLPNRSHQRPAPCGSSVLPRSRTTWRPRTGDRLKGLVGTGELPVPVPDQISGTERGSLPALDRRPTVGPITVEIEKCFNRP
eukprot:5963288-Pleurochrysis_carterae.AAC.1